MRKNWKGYEKMVNAPLLLENLMDEQDYKQHHIADPAGVSVATLSNFLKGKRALNFGAAMLIQKMFFGDNKDFIRNVCKEYEKPEHMKPAMEFLSANYFLDELLYLIEKAKTCRGMDEWCTTYSILLKYQERKTKGADLLIKVREVYHKVSQPELRAVLHIVEANVFAQSREYKSIFRTSDQIRPLIDEVDDSYIKKSLGARLNDVLAQAHLFSKGGQSDARDYAELIISANISKKFTAYAYYIIGTSYMFQDYAKSRQYLTESSRMYKELGLPGAYNMLDNQNIRMLETYWEENLLDTDESIDRSELAHRLAVRGDKDKAVELLDELEETTFRIYYRALATEDYSLHLKALLRFIEEGDFLYAQLPYKKLKKSKEYGFMLDNIYQEWGD